MDINPNEIKKILCIKPRGIGDIVLSTILLENLKFHYKNSTIDYLTEEFAKEAVCNIELVDKVITTKKKDSILKVILEVRKNNYDLIMDLWSNPKTAQITFFSGAKYRVGYSYRGRKYAYNIKGTSGRGSTHSAEHNLELLIPLGVPVISKKIHFSVGKSEKIFADNYFTRNNLLNEKIVGIIPAGSWASKRCEKEKWVEFCSLILKYYKVKILILWGPGDEYDAEYIKNNLQQNCYLAPQSTLSEMAALISKCNFIIANDSGPMHISAALGIPTLGIFGPTNPESHGPYSSNSDYIIKRELDCIICNKLICPYNHECMKELDAELFISKVKSLINI